MATARIRPWPGPVIAPDVHDPACLRHLVLSFVRDGSRVLVLHTESTVGTITQCSAASDVVSLRSRSMRGGEVGTLAQ